MSNKITIDDIFADDEFGLLNSSPKIIRQKSVDDRLIDSFEEINQFIDKLATFLNACGEKPIYILCNDINLSKAYNGGREFFDALESKISNPKIVRRMHFNNNNKDRHFEYGDEYKRNCLIFDDIPDEIRKAYNPFDSCASAQILIKKEQKEVIR